jgi:hypothetical protein
MSLDTTSLGERIVTFLCASIQPDSTCRAGFLLYTSRTTHQPTALDSWVFVRVITWITNFAFHLFLS